ncbi:putative auxin-regulated protein [Nonlabens ulvanivorans]|nr:putative auxin-regulated protein [Nonlabens ulvanivorans]
MPPDNDELPYHEWFIEFGETPSNITAFKETLDLKMREQNSYYDDLIVGKVLQPLVIKNVAVNGFKGYMKIIGKLGGQNKLPRLSNDRKIADVLEQLSHD